MDTYKDLIAVIPTLDTNWQKLAVLMEAIVACQKGGKIAAYVDTADVYTADSFDPRYFTSFGGDMAKILVSQPETLAQATKIVETLVRSGAVDLVIVFGQRMPPAMYDIALRTGTTLCCEVPSGWFDRNT